MEDGDDMMVREGDVRRRCCLKNDLERRYTEKHKSPVHWHAQRVVPAWQGPGRCCIEKLDGSNGSHTIFTEGK